MHDLWNSLTRMSKVHATQKAQRRMQQRNQSISCYFLSKTTAARPGKRHVGKRVFCLILSRQSNHNMANMLPTASIKMLHCARLAQQFNVTISVYAVWTQARTQPITPSTLSLVRQIHTTQARKALKTNECHRHQQTARLETDVRPRVPTPSPGCTRQIECEPNEHICISLLLPTENAFQISLSLFLSLLVSRSLALSLSLSLALSLSLSLSFP